MQKAFVGLPLICNVSPAAGETSDVPEREKRKAEAPASFSVKKRKTEASEASDESASEGSDEQEDSTSEEERPKRRAAAKAKGMKAAQAKSMTKSAFLEVAKALDCHVGDLEFKLEPRIFNTGSCGW